LPLARCVLPQYPHGDRVVPVQYLGAAGGFSGAEVWQLAAPSGALCLRGGPPGVLDPARCVWIHAQLARIAGAGCQLVPQALPTLSGATWVTYGGRLWELSPWLAGTADYRRAPTRDRLEAAMQSVAHLHCCARRGPAGRSGPASSPSLIQRCRLMEQLEAGLGDELGRAVQRQASPELVPRARLILEHYRRCATEVLREVRAAVRRRTPLQVCHGDLWHDHVLFSGSRVTGLVDFAAMKTDSRSLDIARLLGSLVQDDRPGWKIGLAAYEQMEPLSDDERALIPVFDRSSVVLSGMNWLRWLLLERREFADRQCVLRRLDTIIARMAAMQQLGDGPSGTLGCD